VKNDFYIFVRSDFDSDGQTDGRSATLNAALRKGRTITLCCRLEDEARENEKRRDELAALKCELRLKERSIAELSSHNDCLKSELDLVSTKLDKYQCEMEAANQRSGRFVVTMYMYIVEL